MRLIDADLFDKELEEYSYGHCDEEFYTCESIRGMLDDQPTVNPYEWISVEDRLPENLFEAVLVYCPDNKNIYCVYLNARNEWHIFDYGAGRQVTERVTHWMPLRPFLP